MVIQKTVIDVDIRAKDLYFRTDGVEIQGNINLRGGQSVSFDTYVNFFSATKWKKYTNVKSIYLVVKYKGHCIIRLKTFDSDNLIERVIFETEVCSEKIDSYQTKDFNIENLENICYVEIQGIEDSVIYECLYCSSINDVNEIKLACGICTYKREKELKRNVDGFIENIINNTDSILFNKFDIYISDNGHTIDGKLFNESSHVFVCGNKNYGGSAGFARCMIEAKFNKDVEYSHMLLLDDDAETKAYIIERLAVFLMLLNDESVGSLIGGSLMASEMPTLLMEQGGLFLHDRLKLRKQYIDVADKLKAFSSENEEIVNYNGWFFSCFPMSVIKDGGMPLPFFIHGDDIEHGLQFENRIIHLNGICVWHPNPMAKGKQRDYIAYYDNRNFMIINSIYKTKETILKLKFRLLINVFASVAIFRYNRAWYILRGYEDFIKGIRWLEEQDADKLNQDIVGWKKAICYPMLGQDKLNLKAGGNVTAWKQKTILNWLMPSWKREVYDECTDVNNINYLGMKAVCFIDVKTGEGSIFKKDYKELAAIIRKTFSVLFKLKRKSVLQYQYENIVKYKTIEFWRKYLEIYSSAEKGQQG